MKILVAYDGSECADIALKSLHYAGIPDGSEVRVVSVSEWFPVSVAVGASDLLMERPLGNREEASRLAEIGMHRLKEAHPAWEVSTEGFSGSSAHEIVRYADEWGAELIVVGSHGRSAIGRFFLGSTSHQILVGAECAVLIGREGYNKTGEHAPVIMLALDGSDFSKPVADAVLVRSWPAGTTFVLVSAAEYSFDDREEEEAMENLKAIHGDIGDKLEQRGFTVHSLIDNRMIHPKQVILEEAANRGVDCIFMGARGLTGFERFVLGSVSTAVAMGAGCSVEVIRGEKAEME